MNFAFCYSILEQNRCSTYTGVVPIYVLPPSAAIPQLGSGPTGGAGVSRTNSMTSVSGMSRSIFIALNPFPPMLWRALATPLLLPLWNSTGSFPLILMNFHSRGADSGRQGRRHWEWRRWRWRGRGTLSRWGLPACADRCGEHIWGRWQCGWSQQIFRQNVYQPHAADGPSEIIHWNGGIGHDSDLIACFHLEPFRAYLWCRHSSENLAWCSQPTESNLHSVHKYAWSWTGKEAKKWEWTGATSILMWGTRALHLLSRRLENEFVLGKNTAQMYRERSLQCPRGDRMDFSFGSVNLIRYWFEWEQRDPWHCFHNRTPAISRLLWSPRAILTM